MLTDRYELALSTASAAARDAYVEGCAARMTTNIGAIAAFDRAIAADPRFALARAAKAHALLDAGDGAAARTEIAAAGADPGGLTEREVSHVAFFAKLVAGEPDAALTVLYAHLESWPRDAMVLAPAAFTNGLIGSCGRAGQKRMLLALMDRLAPRYGDDGWFAAHHGMSLSENAQWDAAGPKIERALAQNPNNPWAAHARAHVCYELGDGDAGRRFLAAWLETYPRSGALYSHLSWHLAIGHLEAGDAAAASRLFRDAIAPGAHSGTPRQTVTDAVSYLWRWELAGQPRDAATWRAMHDLAHRTFPRPGLAFSDMHIALVDVVADDDAALQTRLDQVDALARAGRYPSEAMIPAVATGFAAFQRGDFATAIAALEPITGELERIGGSRAQLDLVEFTLLKAYVAAHRADDARRMLGRRHRGSPRVPVAGLTPTP